MAKQIINLGVVPNDGLGDTLRDGGDKINDNFDEVYGGGAIDTRQFTTGVPNPSYSEGLVFYDSDKKTLAYYNDEPDMTVNILEELPTRIYNNNGATLTNGTVVKLDGGAVGGLPTAIKAQADTVINARALGVCTHDIGVGEIGYVTSWGSVGGLDTSGYAAGDYLYLSETVAGGLTNVEQKILKPVALVLVSDASDGSILVSQKSSINITAVGQIGSLASSTQTISTTPAPLEIFTNAPFEQNTTIAQTGASPYTASIAPASVGATGFYEVSFSIAISSPTNQQFIFQIYVNGIASGVLGVADLSNNNIDAGSTAFTAITQSVVDNTEDIEIYVYSDGGTPTMTVASCVFSAKRIGNV